MIDSSHDFGMLDLASTSSSSVTFTVGMSVSGYILDAPGLGLRNMVSPFWVAARVSAGGPFFASFILLIIESIAKPTELLSPAIIKNASSF